MELCVYFFKTMDTLELEFSLTLHFCHDNTALNDSLGFVKPIPLWIGFENMFYYKMLGFVYLHQDICRIAHYQLWLYN